MARIRTIKPDFFRHEALYEAEAATRLPLRLAFAGLWTVCDREGRFRWQPRVLKLDVMPFDEVDFAAVLGALVDHGFIVAYEVDGNRYGHIPSWRKHQQINTRESESVIPACDSERAHTIQTTEAHTPKHVHAHVESSGEGEGEGKGREGSRGKQRGARFALAQLPEDWKAFCKANRPDLDPATVFAKFGDYWRGIPGAKGCKLDWQATWRNFVRTERLPPGAKPPDPPRPWHQSASGTKAKGEELGINPDQFRLPDGREDWQAFKSEVLKRAGVSMQVAA